MVHAHDGAAAACVLLAYGSAKDRKRLIKATKRHLHEVAVKQVRPRHDVHDALGRR